MPTFGNRGTVYLWIIFYRLHIANQHIYSKHEIFERCWRVFAMLVLWCYIGLSHLPRWCHWGVLCHNCSVFYDTDWDIFNVGVFGFGLVPSLSSFDVNSNHLIKHNYKKKSIIYQIVNMKTMRLYNRGRKLQPLRKCAEMFSEMCKIVNFREFFL